MNEEYGGARRGAGRRMLYGILLGQIMLMNMGLVNSRDVVTSRSQCVQGGFFSPHIDIVEEGWHAEVARRATGD